MHGEFKMNSPQRAAERDIATSSGANPYEFNLLHRKRTYRSPRKKKTGVPMLLCCFMVSSAVLQVHLSPGIKLRFCQNICTAWIDMTWADFSRGASRRPQLWSFWMGSPARPLWAPSSLVLCDGRGTWHGTGSGCKNSHQNQYQHRNCLEQIVVFFWNQYISTRRVTWLIWFLLKRGFLPQGCNMCPWAQWVAPWVTRWLVDDFNPSESRHKQG